MRKLILIVPVADSEQNHPMSDLPAFFIHPCNTAGALEELCQDKVCSPEDYLMIWLGLVGPSVNLYIPSQLLYPGTGDKHKHQENWDSNQMSGPCQLSPEP
jgi:Autophagocytosis associated protein, active-site domain